MNRPLFAYRLRVQYPEGVNHMHPPEAWKSRQTAEDEWETFQWPRVRSYISYSGAKRRADLLTSYGCVVTIERSLPITWATEG